MLTRHLLDVPESLRTAWPYPGPDNALDLNRGDIRAHIGYRADGSPVWWTFNDGLSWGSTGGCLFGGIGSGKTTLLRSLAITAAHSGLIRPVVSEPVYGDIDPIIRQARDLLAEHRRRQDANKRLRRRLLTPDRDTPLLLWIVDDIHQIPGSWRDEFFSIAVTLNREGNRTGISLVVSTVDPSLPMSFGGCADLRASLVRAQCVWLRMDVRSHLAESGGRVDPTTIPRRFSDGMPTSGVGVVPGEPHLFRVAYLPDDGM